MSISLDLRAREKKTQREKKSTRYSNTYELDEASFFLLLLLQVILLQVNIYILIQNSHYFTLSFFEKSVCVGSFLSFFFGFLNFSAVSQINGHHERWIVVMYVIS